MGLLAMVAVCTDLGPMVATVDDAGALAGTVAGHLEVTGTVDALEIGAGGLTVFRGPLSDLHPVDVSTPPEDIAAELARPGEVGSDGILRHEGEAWALDIDLLPFGGPVDGQVDIAALHRAYGSGEASHERVVADHARKAGTLLLCGPGGADFVRVGAWPEAVALAPGRRATWSTTDEVRVRGPDNRATVYVALPMDRALAASVADELDRALPDARTGVGWEAGMALLAWSWDREQWVPDDVAPVPGEPAVLGLLDLEVGTDPPRPRNPALDPGAEILAKINDVRIASALPPLEWDEGLALVALQHGAPAEERPGAVEVAGPSVEALLTSPYDRVPLLHPGAVRAGIAGVAGVWVAEVELADGTEAAWPAHGQIVPETSFTARQSPDPLPLGRHPDRVWPVGFPITLWTPERIRASAIRCGGEELPHWVVRSPLGEPDRARHLVPKEPLASGVTCTWTASTDLVEWVGNFATPDDPLDGQADLPSAVAEVIRRANATRPAPLRATGRAAALARLMSARTRAMTEGLDPRQLRDVLAPVRGLGRSPVQLCVRPGEAFELDDVLLDARYTEIGADDRATTVTWRSGAVPSLHTPRTCLFLYSGL